MITSKIRPQCTARGVLNGKQLEKNRHRMSKIDNARSKREHIAPRQAPPQWKRALSNLRSRARIHFNTFKYEDDFKMKNIGDFFLSNKPRRRSPITNLVRPSL
jgi:hypothetical protein